MTPVRILVVEDDAGIRQGLLATLASEGYEGVGAKDGVAGGDLGQRPRRVPGIRIARDRSERLLRSAAPFERMGHSRGGRKPG